METNSDFFVGRWKMEDPINGRGDPKNEEGVEMNLEIFFGGGVYYHVT